MEADPTASNNEISMKRAVLKDISIFIHSLNNSEHFTYESFRLRWDEMDLDLLTHFTTTETIISCLTHLGLFSASRPFRDHQLLIFFLFSVYRRRREPFKLSVDRVQMLLGVRMQARMMDVTSRETLDALEALFRRDAFIIVAEDSCRPFFSNQTVASSAISIEQILDRIKRIELFLSSNPVFDQKFHRTGILRLRTLFDRYNLAKKKSAVNLKDEQDFDAVIAGLMKIIEGYEKLTFRFSSFSSAPTTKSIRSRLSHSSLTPIAPTSSPIVDLPTDFFSSANTLRSQSVPATRMRRTSSMREVDLDEFMVETSTSTTNMPDINFY